MWLRFLLITRARKNECNVFEGYMIFEKVSLAVNGPMPLPILCVQRPYSTKSKFRKSPFFLMIFLLSHFHRSITGRDRNRIIVPRCIIFSIFRAWTPCIAFCIPGVPRIYTFWTRGKFPHSLPSPERRKKLKIVHTQEWRQISVSEIRRNIANNLFYVHLLRLWKR